MERKLYFLNDYSDEAVPYVPDLSGIAKWLTEPDPDWHRPEAAKDGDEFLGSAAIVTYHRVDLRDGKWQFTGPLPADFDYIVPAYGWGMGWSGEDMLDSLEDLERVLNDCPSVTGCVIATLTHKPDILTITYHRKGLGDPFCVATET